MGALRMSTTERESFLADLHVGVLAVERADGPPLVTPVWYRYQPGAEVELSTDASSVKGRLLAAAGRATLCAQREELPSEGAGARCGGRWQRHGSSARRQRMKSARCSKEVLSSGYHTS